MAHTESLAGGGGGGEGDKKDQIILRPATQCSQEH